MDEGPQVTCPFCGEQNSTSSKVCIYCGEAIGEEEETSKNVGEQSDPAPERSISFLKVTEGMVLNDRYLIKKKIGTGGFGTVYYAHDKILDENVALKILNPEFNIDSEVKERFLREIKLARKITHPNIVRIYDINEIQGTSIISMEFFESINLKELIQKEGTIKFEKAIEIIKQICLALDAAHELNIIHRDIKPHNILLNKDNVIKIVDFGIARNIYRAPEDGVTKTGTLIGTPDYMSPEQANGQEFDHRSDIYSLGIVIYEMLSGSVPFKSDSPLNVLIQHIQKKHEPIIMKNPNVPEWFSDILDKILEKKPEHRYKSGREIIEDIETCLKREEIKEQAKARAIEYMNQNIFDKALKSAQQAKEIAPDDKDVQQLILKISKRKREADFEITHPDVHKDKRGKLQYRTKGLKPYQTYILVTTCCVVTIFVVLTSFKYFQLSAQDLTSANDVPTIFHEGDSLYNGCLTREARDSYITVLSKDPLCTPAMIKLILTYFIDFSTSNFIFARYTFLCLLILLIISVIKIFSNPRKVLFYVIPSFLLLACLAFVVTFIHITSALNTGKYLVKSKEETKEYEQIPPKIHLDIAKRAYQSEKYLDAIVALENYLILKPLDFMGYYYYYATYWKDFIRKSEIGLPILSIIKFFALIAIFVSSSILILKF